MKSVVLWLLALAAVTMAASTYVADELKYYLERHNVQDEGYEMVAAYAQYGDTLLTHLPQQRLSLRMNADMRYSMLRHTDLSDCVRLWCRWCRSVANG